MTKVTLLDYNHYKKSLRNAARLQERHRADHLARKHLASHNLVVRVRTEWRESEFISRVQAWCEDNAGEHNIDWMNYVMWDPYMIVYCFRETNKAFEFKMLFA